MPLNFAMYSAHQKQLRSLPWRIWGALPILCFLFATPITHADSSSRPIHRDVLVLVPAYEASQLFDTAPGSDSPQCVWGNVDTLLTAKLYFALRMPNPLAARTMLAAGPIDVYRKFVSEMTERHDENPGFAPFTLGSDFFIFAYDWRQEIGSVSAPLLGKALEDYAHIHETKTGIPAAQTRFIIVTHSMGGLVARTLLSEQPELAARIAGLYMAGPPNDGSVKSIETLVIGPSTLKDFSNSFPAELFNVLPSDLNHDVTKLVAITRPSLYELLPTGDPHWTAIDANGKHRQVQSTETFHPAVWNNYWPSAELEKRLFLDTWLKDRLNPKPVDLQQWAYCQSNDQKLSLMLEQTRHWQSIMGRLSDTERLLSHQGKPFHVLYSTGLSTPTAVVTSGLHDNAQSYYVDDPANDGDGTVEASRVIDDLPRNSPVFVHLDHVGHDRLLIDNQTTTYFLKEFSGKEYPMTHRHASEVLF